MTCLLVATQNRQQQRQKQIPFGDDKQEKQEQQQPQVLRLRGSLTRTTSLKMTRVLVGNTKQTTAKTEADSCGMTGKRGKCRGNGNGESS
jgi:hypothetical protein